MFMIWGKWLTGGVIILGCGACSLGTSDVMAVHAPEGSSQAEKIMLLEPGRIVEDDWSRLVIEGEVQALVTIMDDQLAMQLSPVDGAGGLFRRVSFDPNRCRALSWSWLVPKMRSNVDLEDKAGDDVDAALFVLFGNPGFGFAPRPVPTIKYVSSGGDYEIGAVIPNPYAPDIVKNIVVSNSVTTTGKMQSFSRNILADYRRSFGGESPPMVHTIAVFADSDQTREDIDAYFFTAVASCGTLASLS